MPTSISAWSPTLAKIPWHIPPIIRAESLRDSFTPSWISSFPKKIDFPPKISTLVSAAKRVRVLRFENKSAMLFPKRDWEGRRILSFFFPVFWGVSHVRERRLQRSECWRMRFIWGTLRSARVIRWGGPLIFKWMWTLLELVFLYITSISTFHTPNLVESTVMLRQRRHYATKSPYSTLYSGTFPAMIPVFLLGSAVYFVCHFILK